MGTGSTLSGAQKVLPGSRRSGRGTLVRMQPTTARLSTRQAAEYLGISEDTLRWWRHRGDRGPRSYALSARHVVYDLADLDAWADQRKAETQRCGD